MKNKKWYYKICNENDETILYCSVDLPVKAEKLAEFLGFEEFNYTVTEISEKEYFENIENEE